MADDDDDDCMLAEDAFAASGAPGVFKCVGDGVELLDYLTRSQPPALILLDISMPLMDGFEALEKMKANPAHRSIPVVILTTSREEDTDKPGMKRADDFYTKPTTYGEWIDIMKALAERWLSSE
jgi:CheY-like chemotaxis protein